MLEHIEAGWQLGEFGSPGGTFFCTRGTAPRALSTTPSAPAQAAQVRRGALERESGALTRFLAFNASIAIHSVMVPANLAKAGSAIEAAANKYR
jgi:hypothetical protein